MKMAPLSPPKHQLQKLRKSFIRDLAKLVPSNGLRVSQSNRRVWGASYRNTATSEPIAVVLPESTEQVQAVVRHCVANGVSVIPRGAGTNLVEATQSVGDCVMIATTRMRRILEFDEVSGTIRVQAGITNRAVGDHVRGFGWKYGPDPSSQRTCTIGGNIAMNSSGASALKSGATVENVIGLTAVLPDGQRVETHSDDLGVSGFDQTGFLCGSEGQMGLVTEAVLRLIPRACETRTIMVAFAGHEEGLRAASRILGLGNLPTRFDFLDGETARMCEAYTAAGYPAGAGSVLLLDIEGLPVLLDALQHKILHCTNRRTAMVIGTEPEERERLWSGRMKIYGAAAAQGSHVMLDGAIPLSRVPEIIDQIDRISTHRRVMACTTLHIGDGTVHAFLFDKIDGRDGMEALDDCATDIRLACVELGGSLSAEYGIGSRNQALLDHQFSSSDLAVQNRCLTVVRSAASFDFNEPPFQVLEAG